MVANAYNLSSWEAKAGRLRIQGEPGSRSETLSKKKSRGWWLTPVILPTQEAGIKRIAV
jgi:hypothetical protein